MSSQPHDASYYLTPTDKERFTLILIGIYAGAILILWNLPFLKVLIYPFKLITVALHEFGHAAVGCCTGAKIEGIKVDPEEGGATTMRGGNPYCTLPAGYLGSSFFGAIMVFAGFDTLASKIVSVFIGVCLLITMYWARNWLTRVLTFAFICVIIALRLIDGGKGLTFVVLFMGVMSCLYSLWDIVEDLVMRRVNESDATKFAKLCGCCTPQFWGVVWFLISLLFLTAAILVALVVFKNPPDSSSSSSSSS